MEKKNMHHLPVIGDDKHVAGMLTETDLFRALIDLLN
jgi:CBS domain-containing protein